jgi:hypothetical protein
MMVSDMQMIDVHPSTSEGQITLKKISQLMHVQPIPRNSLVHKVEMKAGQSAQFGSSDAMMLTIKCYLAVYNEVTDFVAVNSASSLERVRIPKVVQFVTTLQPCSKSVNLCNNNGAL